MGLFDFLKKSIMEDDDYFEDEKKDAKYKEPKKIEPKPIITNRELDNKQNEKFVEEQILMVIRNYTSLEDLKKYSEIAATKIGSDNAKIVPKFLQWKILKPEELSHTYKDQQTWEMIVENAVLTILYSFKDEGVSYLVDIMKNNIKYRMKSIKFLCDIAMEGFCVELIIEEVGKIIEYLGKDDRIKVFSYLGNIKMNETVIGVIQFYYQEFLVEGDIAYAYLALVQLINVAENCSKSHMEFLKMVATGRVTVNVGNEIVAFQVEERLSIKAALTYYLLNPEDTEMIKLIRKYEFECDDRELLEEIDSIMN